MADKGIRESILDYLSQGHSYKLPGSSQDHEELPQEWPDHLHPEAKVKPVERVFHRGEFLLDFARMPAASFEQFCWSLLTKEQSLHGCQRLGKNGAEQGGIDLFAYDERFTDKLNVYECKAWKKFDSTRLTEAIERFLQGRWKKDARSFTLILAQEDLGEPLARRWDIEKKRLKRSGIEGELWTAHHLTQKTQSYPDLLSKFFPGAHVETFGNLWMERSGFLDAVSKAVFDPRERVAQKAREFIEKSGRLLDSISGGSNLPAGSTLASGHQMTEALSFSIDAFRKVSHSGRHWFYSGPWFSVSVFLPDQISSKASAAFDFHQEDLKGVTITVSHDWLLKCFLFAAGALLSSKARTFIVGKMPGEPDQYLIDLPNCRLTLQEEIVQELADVSDLLTMVMRDALKAIESNWSAVDFPFFDWGGSHRVVIASIREDVWREIGRFTEEHDYTNGSTPWHIFDGHAEFLKPCHQAATAEFDAGYHCLISALKEEGATSGNRVKLLWAPDDLTYRSPSSKGWWPCEFALRWLNETLLPEIKRRVFRREFGSWWKRFLHSKQAEEFSRHLDNIFVARDAREPSLLDHGRWNTDILRGVEALQYFFTSASIGAAGLEICQQDVENLYRAIAIVAVRKRGFPGYVASSLSLDGRPDDHAQLIGMIHHHIDSGRVVSNCHVVDYAFRAMLELLDESDSCGSTYDQETIMNWLLPFARLRDDGLLVSRHTKRT